ncbi:MAG: Rcas_1661 family thioredoxin-like (seleno)lipoprotein [Chloroflexota bacterium]|nr:MAG: disulfide bond formation protein DsbA [Chloroflexota bacterium]
MPRLILWAGLLAAAIALGSCASPPPGGGSTPAAATPPPAATETAAPPATRAAFEPAGPTPDIASVPRGRTPEGYNYLGDPQAPVTLLDYSDFLCTTCAFHVLETEPQIYERYIATGKVRLVYRHLLQLGEGSLRASEAAECAADQGKFWEMRRAIYEGQSAFNGPAGIEGALAVFAQDIGLNMGDYNTCMVARTHRAAIEADAQAARDAGIRSRPVFDINGTRLVGAQPFGDFQQAIEAALPQ